MRYHVVAKSQSADVIRNRNLRDVGPALKQPGSISLVY